MRSATLCHRTSWTASFSISSHSVQLPETSKPSSISHSATRIRKKEQVRSFLKSEKRVCELNPVRNSLAVLNTCRQHVVHRANRNALRYRRQFNVLNFNRRIPSHPGSAELRPTLPHVDIQRHEHNEIIRHARLRDFP